MMSRTTSRKCFYALSSIVNCPFRDDDVVLRKDPSWYTSASSWLMVGKQEHSLLFNESPCNYKTKVTPWGLRSMLNWVKDHYGGLDLFITEVSFLILF